MKKKNKFAALFASLFLVAMMSSCNRYGCPNNLGDIDEPLIEQSC